MGRLGRVQFRGERSLLLGQLRAWVRGRNRLVSSTAGKTSRPAAQHAPPNRGAFGDEPGAGGLRVEDVGRRGVVVEERGALRGLRLGDGQPRLELVKQRVGALLAQRVVNVRLPGERVKETVGHLAGGRGAPRARAMRNPACSWRGEMDPTSIE